MEFCRLCSKGFTDQDCLEGVLSLKNSNYGSDVDKMLGIFQGVEGNSKDLSDIACVQCFDSLKFCYKFYTILDDATKLLLRRHRSNSKALRPIQPKPVDTATESAADEIKKSSSKSKRRYFCEECSCEFTTYRQILSHNKTHEIRNVCQYCGVFFIDEQEFNRHVLITHTDLKFHCDKCQTTVRCRNDLFRHMKKNHNIKERDHNCNECNQIFVGRNNLEKHIEVAHPSFLRRAEEENISVSPLEDREPDMIEEFLEDMDEEFLDDILLNQDQNSFCWDELSLTPFDVEMDLEDPGIDEPGGGSYVCPKCTDRYATPKTLIHHLAHEHNKFLLVCNDVDCGASFNRYAKLKDHYINVHLKANADEATQSIRGLKHSTPLQCSTCKKNFKTPVGLKYHLKTHAGLKSLCCPYCEKKFIANVNLYAHMRNVHLEIKKHLCKLCDRRFASLDHLKKHVMSVHQKERNYLCYFCGKTFAQSSHLNQHLLTHTVRKSERLRRSQ